MKIWKVLILIFMVLPVLTSMVIAGETLYNGIVLPDEWPPKIDELKRELIRIQGKFHSQIAE